MHRIYIVLALIYLVVACQSCKRSTAPSLVSSKEVDGKESQSLAASDSSIAFSADELVQTIEIANEGDSTEVIDAVTVSGSDASLFKVDELDFPLKIKKGKSLEFDVEYKGEKESAEAILNVKTDEGRIKVDLTFGEASQSSGLDEGGEENGDGNGDGPATKPGPTGLQIKLEGTEKCVELSTRKFDGKEFMEVYFTDCAGEGDDNLLRQLFTLSTSKDKDYKSLIVNSHTETCLTALPMDSIKVKSDAGMTLGINVVHQACDGSSGQNMAVEKAKGKERARIRTTGNKDAANGSPMCVALSSTVESFDKKGGQVYHGKCEEKPEFFLNIVEFGS